MAYILDKTNISQTLIPSVDNYPEGIIIPINKPYLWTSADVIRKVKYHACKFFNKKNLKVGHAGTLDPLATGVLLVCIHKATSLAESLQKSPKEYIAGISFGLSSVSYDLEKEVEVYPIPNITKNDILNSLAEMTGEMEQIAPLFSAKSIDGIRAYELARKEYVQSKKDNKLFSHEASLLLQSQKINIYECELLNFQQEYKHPQPSIKDSKNRINLYDISEYIHPAANIRIACSKGTYIRAFARDLGEKLNSVGMLNSLERSKSGNFNIKNCLDISEAISLFTD